MCFFFPKSLLSLFNVKSINSCLIKLQLCQPGLGVSQLITLFPLNTCHLESCKFFASLSPIDGTSHDESCYWYWAISCSLTCFLPFSQFSEKMVLSWKKICMLLLVTIIFWRLCLSAKILHLVFKVLFFSYVGNFVSVHVKHGLILMPPV